jgi:hypothetical protein
MIRVDALDAGELRRRSPSEPRERNERQGELTFIDANDDAAGSTRTSSTEVLLPGLEDFIPSLLRDVQL